MPLINFFNSNQMSTRTKNIKYILVFLAVIPIIATVYYLSQGPRQKVSEKSDIPSLPPSPANPNVMHGIKVTKKVGDMTLLISVSTVRPHLPKPGNLLQYAMEKSDGTNYKLQIRRVKLRLEGKGRYLELEAGSGFSTEDFTTMRLKGLRINSQKGFSLAPDTKEIKMTVIGGNNIEVRRIQ